MNDRENKIIKLIKQKRKKKKNKRSNLIKSESLAHWLKNLLLEIIEYNDTHSPIILIKSKENQNGDPKPAIASLYSPAD